MLHRCPFDLAAVLEQLDDVVAHSLDGILVVAFEQDSGVPDPEQIRKHKVEYQLVLVYPLLGHYMCHDDLGFVAPYNEAFNQTPLAAPLGNLLVALIVEWETQRYQVGSCVGNTFWCDKEIINTHTGNVVCPSSMRSALLAERSAEDAVSAP